LKETKGNYDIQNKVLYAPDDIREKLLNLPASPKADANKP